MKATAAEEFEALLAQVRKLPPMTAEQRRAQAISFVAYNIAIDRPEADVWQLLLDAAKAYDKRHDKGST